MKLSVLAETSTTITLGWTPPAGQEGYLPTIDGSENLTDGKRHPGTSETQNNVKIGKPSGETNPASKHKYGVKILGAIDSGEHDPTGTQPPPTGGGGTPIFDGRASRMTLLKGSTVTGGNNAQQQPEVWGSVGDGDGSDGLYFMRDDIRLVPDPVYGQVYLFETDGSSQNPWWTDTNVVSAEMNTGYALRLGEDRWYSGVTKLDPANQNPSWQTLQQCCYNGGVSSPPFGFYMHKDGFGIERHYGMVPKPYEQAGGYDNQTLHDWNSIKGKWIEYVFQLRMTIDNTGAVNVWTRVRDNGETKFTQRYSAGGVTFQWLNGQAPKLGVTDKLSSYWEWSGPKSSFPTNRLWHRGLVQHKTQQDAFATMG